MGDGSLRHAVNGFGGKRYKTGLRADVNDPPVLLPDHHPADRLGCEERPLEIDVQRIVKILFRDLLGRGRIYPR